MKTSKGLFMVIATLLVIGLLSGCGPHRFHEGGFAEHALSHMDDWAQGLNLNGVQEAKYQEIRSKMETSLTEQAEKRRLVFSRLRTEINSQNPDANRIAGVLKDRIDELSALLEQNLDLIVEFYNVLDADQQARIMETIQKRFNRMDRFINET